MSKELEPLKEILPKNGLVYSEKSNLIEVLCRPRIMPIKSNTLKRLEELDKEAAAAVKPPVSLGNAPPGSSYGSGSSAAGAQSGSSAGFADVGRPTSSARGRL